LAEERDHRRRWPRAEFSYRPQLARRVYLDFTVRWKDNFYEVPYQYRGRRVLCQEVGDQVDELDLVLASVGQLPRPPPG
jgi:hypothetical protein